MTTEKLINRSKKTPFETKDGNFPIASDERLFRQCAQMLSEQHYAVIDQFLTAEETARLAAGLENKYTRNKFKKAGMGKDSRYQKDTDIRGDLIYWIDHERDLEIKRFLGPRIRSFADYLRRECFLSIKDWEMHYAVYPPGASYQRHLDRFKNDDNRLLTFICYLNFGWKNEDEGSLRIYLDEEGQAEEYADILPAAGRFVCFKSDILEHEVLPTKRTRYSLSGWFLRRKRDLKFLK